MRTSLVIDNFTLQDVGETLRIGLTDDNRVELAPSDTPDGYEARAVPSPGVQVETLLQLLNVIVLQDQLIVEASAVETWKDASPFFTVLENGGIVIAKPFSNARSEWLPIRDHVQEILCFSPKLAADFAEFRSNWKPGIQHPIFSTLLWSTAGMIARSQYLNTPYLSHPSRAE